MTSVTAEVSEPVPGIRRLRFDLPLGFQHVHCWFVRGASGGWLIVDTAIAVPGVEPLWESALGGLDGPVEKILVTHFHPDHVGGAALVAELTGAPVYQGRSDFDDCRVAWADPGASDRLAELLERHGFPAKLGVEARAVRRRVSSQVRFHPDPVLVEAGDEIDGWRVHHFPGHAPGHLAFARDGVLAAGDVLLARITPSIPLDLLSGPDPLGTISPRSNGWFSSARRSCFPVTRTSSTTRPGVPARSPGTTRGGWAPWQPRWGTDPSTRMRPR